MSTLAGALRCVLSLRHQQRTLSAQTHNRKSGCIHARQPHPCTTCWVMVPRHDLCVHLLGITSSFGKSLTLSCSPLCRPVSDLLVCPVITTPQSQAMAKQGPSNGQPLWPPDACRLGLEIILQPSSLSRSITELLILGDGSAQGISPVQDARLSALYLGRLLAYREGNELFKLSLTPPGQLRVII